MSEQSDTITRCNINANHFKTGYNGDSDPYVCWSCGSFDLEVSDETFETGSSVMCVCRDCRKIGRGRTGPNGDWWCRRLSEGYFRNGDIRKIALRKFNELCGLVV